MASRADLLWDVVEEHLADAAFLWERWERALVSPALGVGEVAEGVEERLAANLEGLAVAGAAALPRILEPALDEGEPGEAFAAASTTLELPGGPGRVWAALARAEGERGAALIRAVALSRAIGPGDLGPMLEDPSATVVAAGLEAFALRGEDAGAPLLRHLGSVDAAVAVPALRAACFTGQAVRGHVERAWSSRDADIRDGALEAGLRLGLRPAFLACRHIVEERDPRAQRALALLALGGDPADLPRIEKASAEPSLRAAALLALGRLGAPAGLETIVAAMKDPPPVARIAGEAFTAITGIAVQGELQAAEPQEAPLPPLEEDDLDAQLVEGPEAELPLPNGDAVAALLRTLGPGPDRLARQEGGQPATPRNLLRRFSTASMRRRGLIAIELAVRSSGSLRLETRDWALEQLRRERRDLVAFPTERLLAFSRALRS